MELNPERILGIWLGGVPLETYLATILAVPAVAIATLNWANFPWIPSFKEPPMVQTETPRRSAQPHAFIKGVLDANALVKGRSGNALVS